MQTNDLNRLAGSFGMTTDDLGGLLVSPLTYEFTGTMNITKEEVLKMKTAINTAYLIKVRADVSKFQTLGKSRRWIKRYIKRKYNITEY